MQTNFYNWQNNPDGYDWNAPPFEACSPRLRAILKYGMDRWALTSLGCHMDRDIRGGSVASTHAFGAAMDLSWKACGRVTLDEEILPLFIDFSADQGIEAIHDYDGMRIWRPPAYRDDLGQVHYGGWKPSTGENMGKGNQWIHVEVHPTRFSDGRTFQECMPSTPASTKGFTVDFIVPEVLKPQNPPQTGRHVVTIQSLLKGLVNPLLLVDGVYGIKTIAAVQDFQAAANLDVDGMCGPKTINKLLNG